MRVFSIFIVALLINCAPSIVSIDKNYTPPPDNKAALIPINPESIYNYDDVDDALKDAFKNDQRNIVQIIADSLNIAIKNVLAQSLHKVSFSPLTKLDSLNISTKNNQCFDIVTRRAGEDSVTFCLWVPRKTAFDTLENDISVLFVISSIDFRRTSQAESPGFSIMQSPIGMSGFSTMQFHPGHRTDELEATVQFNIWDKNTSTVISYGQFKVSERISFELTRKTWLRIFNKIGQGLIQNSPF